MLVKNASVQKNSISLRVVLLVSFVLFNQTLTANSLTDKAESNDSQNTVQSWGRDPFTPSNLMYERVGVQDGRMNRVYGFIPSNENAKIPTMKLRGLMQKMDEFIALLEVQGIGTFMVREGDEFNIDPSQPKNAIRISKITRLSVTVETGRLGSIRVLR